MQVCNILFKFIFNTSDANRLEFTIFRLQFRYLGRLKQTIRLIFPANFATTENLFTEFSQ